ncbi:hypothetical protein PVAND_008547 [Polypedilum vanderplanki]|uniref:Uncharacterized protein n=1 Tax=Polypedilum vanderplanki TaxID=319348 RepID=A0A9J6CBD6_POLVA|nr:hypothetical protein PVAND_008547 [Polypedilum vanderplanki]
MESSKVPLPSASEPEHQTIFEKQSKAPQVVEKDAENQSVHSESDNEGVDDVVDSVIKNIKNDVNLDETFDKIVPAKVETGLLETDIDAIVEKAAEIVNEQINDVKEKVNIAEDEIKANIEESEIKAKVEIEIKTKVEDEKQPAANDNTLTKEIIAQYSKESHEKPPVPIQTYLWEDIKRAKEQVSGNNGGYPWTHLYKNKLGENEQPEVILTYKRSPKSGRRSESDSGTPKAQKKILTEVENVETKSENPENIETEAAATNEENRVQDDDDDEEPLTELTDDIVKLDPPEQPKDKKPKGILKKSQKIFTQMKPSTSKFDSDSLKRKIKTPIAKIKKMADDGISKVKSIKKTPSFSKSDNVPQEKLEILKLKESPKSQHRDFASFIVKQDSDDTVDIVDLEQSPSEVRKNRGVTPDEIINLPVSSTEKIETDSCRNDNLITIGDKKREHHYEDIEDFISKIVADTENVERIPSEKEHDIKPQDNISDPIFDEFSCEMNKKIRKSLSAQDDSIRQELMKRIPKIEELEKQISDEDKEEKIEEVDKAVKSSHLLAPISSIDSTSSDEDRRAQLSIVAEESETSESLKKKSFDEPSVDIMDVESLQIDDSDVSTLIDDEKISNVTVVKEIVKEKTQIEIEVEKPKENEDEKVIEEKKSEEIEEKQLTKETKEEQKIEEIKEPNETQEKEEIKIDESNNESQQATTSNDELNVKEDVEIIQNLETPTPIKINPKWSKMRNRIKNRRILRGQCAVPRQKSLSRSRAESSAASPLEVRCACQFFQSDSLIPERINPIGSRPPSRVSAGDNKPIFCSKHNIFEEEPIEEENLSGSILSFGKSSVPDYYAVTNLSYNEKNFNKENQPPTIQPQPQIPNSFQLSNQNLPPIEIETFRADFPRVVNEQTTNHQNIEYTNLNFSNPPEINILRSGQFSSQKSLDRYSTSALLARYRPKSHSVAPSLQGSRSDIRMLPRMSKTVSFDYGKPTSNTQPNENPNYDQYHRMSPMVFPVRERMQKMERLSVSRDHEYEPIGEPMASAVDDEMMNIDETDLKRKSSDTHEQGSEKKLLRIPTEESEDNISAQDFQDEIENRFFRREIEPIHDNQMQQHQEKIVDEAVIIDEEPVAREIPKKKSFIASASDSSKNLHKKIKAQASSLKSSINNKIKKKPKEKPVAVEVAQVEIEPQDEEEGENVEEEKENLESITINMQESSEEAKKPSKMSKFTKNIKKPSLPKFKKPQFKKPEMSKFTPKMPELKMSEKFSNLRKLGRSKSLKEESTADSTSLNTPEVLTAEPVTKKKFDFGTYPRMIRDKFKRPKIPERSDRSMVSDSPARDDEFNRVSQSFAQRGPVASRWPEYAEEESGKYQHFDSETDLERERIEFEHENVRQMMNEEQRQLEDMDRENLQIHLMAKQEKFRKPFVERQESDVTSEDDKLMWSGMLNKNVKQQDEEDEDFEPNALRFNENYKFTLDAYNNQELNRSCTPATNQETQSSGSSGTRRRRGYLDDDDEYFMREQQPIGTNIHSSDYIDSAIKEGLSEPDANALTQMDHEYTPERPTRSLKRKKKGEKRNQSVEREEIPEEYFRTYPPNRPTRREKKSISIEPEDEIPFHDEILDDTSEIIDENELRETYKGIEHPDLDYMRDDFDNDMDYKVPNLPVPPTPPRRRRKKKIHGIPTGFSTLRNEHLMQRTLPLKSEKIIVYHQESIPLAQEEHFTTPTPTPRRTQSRSRSQMSNYTLDDADSFKKDSIDEFMLNENKENNDLNHNYATIKKETPSRPVRRKRSTKSLGDRQFATLPLMPRRSDLGAEIAPPRPPRNYCTIAPEKPDKPPRRKSAGSLVEISKTMRDDDYEEILDSNTQDNRQRLKSGDVINKMKDRPLPPPPRPSRAGKKQKKDEPEEDKHDKDDGAEKIIEPLSVDIVDNVVAIEEQIVVEEVKLAQIDETESKLPRQDSDFESKLPRQNSELSEPERPIEVEVSTQTDPVPDEEFTMEDDEDIDIEEFMGADGKIKTLEDILKEEQEAELERARQLQEAENLSRGIERFRESNQRSLSEKSRASTADRSRSLSRPITPSAVVVEMKKSSPIIFDKQEQIMTEAGLFIHPITYDDYGIQADEEETNQQPTQEENLPQEAAIEENISTENLDVNNNLTAEVNIQTEELQDEEQLPESPEPNIDEIIKQAQTKYAEEGDDEELDAEMQRKIEEMIESVMNSAREEAEWLRHSQDNVRDETKIENVEEIKEPEQKQSPVVEEEIKEIENIEIEAEAPMPPPRRKSNIEESILKREMPDEEELLKQVEEEIQSEEIKSEPIEIQEESTKEQQAETDEDRLELSQQISEERPSSPFPSRIHLSSLEIDNLSVSALQAGRITASEIDSHSIVTNEFECKSTTPQPTVQQTIEIPPGLIEEIVERVRNAERAERAEKEQQQKESKIEKPQVIQQIQEAPKMEESDPPLRPPLPAEYQQPTTQVPASFYRLRDYSEPEDISMDMDKSSQQHPPPQLPQQHHHQRRKKHYTKKRDSTSDEDYQKDQRPRSRAGITSNQDQSVAALGGQFIRACGNSLMDSGSQLMAILRASSKDENNHDLHVALLILIIVVAGLFLMGMGEKSVHHHHWDFFNPPENPGR